MRKSTSLLTRIVGVSLLLALGTTPSVSAHAEHPSETGGYNALFMGHSFFNLAKGLDPLARRAGFRQHRQAFIFLGGPMGTPGWFWEKEETRRSIQARLRTGKIDLVGMTYCSKIPGAKNDPKVDLDDYKRWVDFALAQNSNTKFCIGVPWPTFPDDPIDVYEANYQRWRTHVCEIIDALREEYPENVFFSIPYGKGAIELRKLFEAGKLPEIELLKSTNNRARPRPGVASREPLQKSKLASDEVNPNALYADALGHPQQMLKTLSQLVFLKVIYKYELDQLDFDTGYQTDLRAIAKRVADEDPYAAH